MENVLQVAGPRIGCLKSLALPSSAVQSKQFVWPCKEAIAQYGNTESNGSRLRCQGGKTRSSCYAVGTESAVNFTLSKLKISLAYLSL